MKNEKTSVKESTPPPKGGTPQEGNFRTSQELEVNKDHEKLTQIQAFWAVTSLFLVFWNCYAYAKGFINLPYEIVWKPFTKIVFWLFFSWFLVEKVYKKSFKIEFTHWLKNWKQSLWYGLLFGIVFSFTFWDNGFNFKNYLSLDDIINAVIVAPIIEEILFRGSIYSFLESKYDWFVNSIITSVLFVTFHFGYWLAIGNFTLSSMVYIFIFGMMLAVLRKSTKSIVGGIWLHALNNLLASLS